MSDGLEKEAYWNQAIGRLRGLADSEIDMWKGSETDHDLLYSPHGILSHQRSTRRLIDVQKASSQRRLEALQRQTPDLPSALATKIAGNTIAYAMYTSSEKESKRVCVDWAAEPSRLDEAQQIIAHPDYSAGQWSRITPPGFELEDVPTRELQKRLQRGEIIPREEWLPSDDLRNRKVISTTDANSRIQFGEKLRDEATALMDRYRDIGSKPEATLPAYDKRIAAAGILRTPKKLLTGEDLVRRANLLYTQGCNLLKYYVCQDSALDLELQDLLRTFRHNAAVTHLKLREYRSCIRVCEEGLLFDVHDGKLCWLKAKAFQELGEVKLAIELYRGLAEDGYATEDHRSAAREAWRKALALERASDLKKGKLVKNWYLEEAHLAAENPASPRTPPTNCTALSSRKGVPERELQKAAPKRLDLKPGMEPERFIQLLQDITRLYTSPVNSARIGSIKAAANYDEKQIILKLREFLPSILHPLFTKYEVEGDSYEEKKRAFDRLEYEVQVSAQVSDRLRGLVRFHLDNLREISLGS